MRQCGGEHPILFFKGENVRATTLLAFFEEVHISKRTLVNEQLAFTAPSLALLPRGTQ